MAKSSGIRKPKAVLVPINADDFMARLRVRPASRSGHDKAADPTRDQVGGSGEELGGVFQEGGGPGSLGRHGRGRRHSAAGGRRSNDRSRGLNKILNLLAALTPSDGGR